MSPHLDPRQIDALVDGEWGPSARRHVETCQDCRRAYERLRALRTARDLATPPALSLERSRAMQERFARALEAERCAPRPRALPRPLLVAAGVGALLLLSSGVIALWSSGASEAPQLSARDPAPAAPHGVTKPAAQTDVEPAPEEDLAADLELPGETPSPLAVGSAASVATPEQPAAALGEAAKDQSPRRPGKLYRPPRATPQRGEKLAAGDQLEAAADAHLANIEKAEEREQIALAFAAFREFCATRGRAMEPRALALRAERVASLALPTPFDEEAAYLACESALASQRYESAYRICSTYLERFPRGPRARDVAYLTATVARRYLGDCRAAVTRYTQALMFSGMLQSFNDEAYFGRALCHAQLGENDAARADLDLYLHKRPSRIDAAEVKALAEELGRPSSPTRDR
jgi:tetratricopeptide (TPR) repeat protein